MAVHNTTGKDKKKKSLCPMVRKILSHMLYPTCFWIIPQESVSLKGGRGSASMVQKCKLCSRENSIGMS